MLTKKCAITIFSSNRDLFEDILICEPILGRAPRRHGAQHRTTMSLAMMIEKADDGQQRAGAARRALSNIVSSYL